jgi:three-Cys-motif partner protein
MKGPDRAVMFLDPFGMQVSWNSIERIGSSHQIDLWYLAPIGGAYGRLMQLDGRIPAERRKLLDQALGGSGWYEALYSSVAPDMLGHAPPAVRDRGWEAIAEYFMSRWRDVFGPGALDVTLPLGHPGRLPFLLCFACSNRNPRAYRPALNIARHLIEGARGGRLV